MTITLRRADVGAVTGWVTERKRTRNAHHVAFDKIESERHLLDSLVYAVDTLFGVREDNVGFLVIACEYALDITLISQMNGWMDGWMDDAMGNWERRREKGTQRLWRVRLGERGAHGLIWRCVFS